ncbi:hypothetical protein [Planctomicrobium sp. SH527]|uniref:hypothetical protein n=1 Tax=Planctomicrobium sp. SH527 TaxID=3448123 RepID=UPI003F5B02CA
MSVISQLMQSDSSLIFRDWGVPAQLRETTSSYNVESGEVDEQSSTTLVTIIPQQNETNPVAATAATLQFNEHHYLIQKLDVPQGVVLTSSQLLVNETCYRILTVHESQVPGLLLLHCVP